ncbi:hypothetical protein GCM10010492_59520 [Saccharothrix mutabilis subsp. mutabilis]|uniref:PH domain-containing protein n=2 Tax=Saccharothrix mutabilis TaxID=33921 RepID=A0ABN0UI12_9PSEU
MPVTHTPGMGEWKVVVPRGGRAGARTSAIVHGSALVILLALAWAGYRTWATVLICVFLVVSTPLSWRIARTGIYVGPHGVKIYHPFKRPVVVPWKDIARFEAQPVHAPHLPVVGATINLVGTRTHPTPVKLGRNWRFDAGVHRLGYDIVLTDDEFREALTSLNRAIRPHVTPPSDASTEQ